MHYVALTHAYASLIDHVPHKILLQPQSMSMCLHMGGSEREGNPKWKNGDVTAVYHFGRKRVLVALW